MTTTTISTTGENVVDEDEEETSSFSLHSPRTVALNHFRDDRLLQSARLLRKYCFLADDWKKKSDEYKEKKE